MKDYLIISYEGNVRINDIPNCISKEKIIDIAINVLNNKNSIVSKNQDGSTNIRAGYPLTNLSNVDIYKNDEIYKYKEKKFNGEFPDNFYISVDYEDWK